MHQPGAVDRTQDSRCRRGAVAKHDTVRPRWNSQRPAEGPRRPARARPGTSDQHHRAGGRILAVTSGPLAGPGARTHADGHDAHCPRAQPRQQRPRHGVQLAWRYDDHLRHPQVCTGLAEKHPFERLAHPAQPVADIRHEMALPVRSAKRLSMNRANLTSRAACSVVPAANRRTWPLPHDQNVQLARRCRPARAAGRRRVHPAGRKRRIL